MLAGSLDLLRPVGTWPSSLSHRAGLFERSLLSLCPTIGQREGAVTFSEIRDSTRAKLLDKVRKHDYKKYLWKASIQKTRGFSNQEIVFDFPVTALIGPNGSGKSAVLGAAGCAYKEIKPGTFFPKSTVGDESMAGWRIEYELAISRSIRNRPSNGLVISGKPDGFEAMLWTARSYSSALREQCLLERRRASKR